MSITLFRQQSCCVVQHASVKQAVHLQHQSASETDTARLTYLRKPLCRWQALRASVETLAEWRWLMSDGIANGRMEIASLGKVSMLRQDR